MYLALLGALAKLRKETVNLFMCVSVRSSSRNKFGSSCKNFQDIR